MRYVIAYDVVDDGRRDRVFKCLEGAGRRIQKSVFECDLTPQELARVRNRIKDLVDVKEDRCHFYPICAACYPARTVLGEEIEPDWADTVIA